MADDAKEAKTGMRFLALSTALSPLGKSLTWYGFMSKARTLQNQNVNIQWDSQKNIAVPKEFMNYGFIPEIVLNMMKLNRPTFLHPFLFLRPFSCPYATNKIGFFFFPP